MRTCRPRGGCPIMSERNIPMFNFGDSMLKQSSRKGTVCSGEASVFCYGHERRRLEIQNDSQLGSYPLLALMVRTIKYLGIYRQKVSPSALACRDRPRVRRTDGCLEKAVVGYACPSFFRQSISQCCPPLFKASPDWRPRTASSPKKLAATEP
jgi:hypothetical protein